MIPITYALLILCVLLNPLVYSRIPTALGYSPIIQRQIKHEEVHRARSNPPRQRGHRNEVSNQRVEHSQPRPSAPHAVRSQRNVSNRTSGNYINAPGAYLVQNGIVTSPISTINSQPIVGHHQSADIPVAIATEYHGSDFEHISSTEIVDIPYADAIITTESRADHGLIRFILDRMRRFRQRFN